MSDGGSAESSYVSPCWEKDGTFHMVCIVVISVGVVVSVVTVFCTRQGRSSVLSCVFTMIVNASNSESDPATVSEKRNFISTNMPAIVKIVASRNLHPDYQTLPEAEDGQGEGRDRVEGFPRKQGEPEGSGRGGGGGCLRQPVPLGCRGGSGVTRGDSCDERGLDTHNRDFICDLDGSVITSRSQTCELIPAPLYISHPNAQKSFGPAKNIYLTTTTKRTYHVFLCSSPLPRVSSGRS